MVLQMIDHTIMIGRKIMHLRKLLWLHGSNAVILPPAFLRQLEIAPGDYLEVGLSDDSTILIRKHAMPNERRRPRGKQSL